MNYKPTHIKITALEMAILLGNVQRAQTEDGIGFEDADNSLEKFSDMLNLEIAVPKSLIERALWSSNLLEDRQKFWHPMDHTFHEFLSELGIDKTFDRYYNLIGDEDEA